MTRISYIQGPPKVPANELPDRGREVKAGPDYIPYLGMTEGQMSLALLREQLKLYSVAYPDFPEYRQGLTMVENALYKGIGNYKYLGAIPDNLQAVAALINRAAGMTQTAGGELFAVKQPKNVYIGAPIVPITQEDCKWLASVAMGRKYWGNDPSRWPKIAVWENLNAGGSIPISGQKATKAEWLQLVEDCEFRKEMERLLNEKLEKCSHHMLYKSVPSNYPPVSGTAMNLKRILHNAGIESLANAAGVSIGNMRDWTEIGVQRSNALKGIGPLGSVISGFYVATNGSDKAYQDFVQWQTGAKSVKIGIAPAVVTAIVAIVTAALAVAQEIVKAINLRKVTVMASAQGFGTTAYNSEIGDLAQGGVVTPGAGGNNTGLVLAAAAAGAYLLLDDEK